MECYECIEAGMRIEVMTDDQRAVWAQVAHVVMDVISEHELMTSERAYVCTTADGQWMLYEDYPEEESQGHLFASKKMLVEFLWDRHEPMDLYMLDCLDALRLDDSADVWQQGRMGGPRGDGGGAAGEG